MPGALRAGEVRAENSMTQNHWFGIGHRLAAMKAPPRFRRWQSVDRRVATVHLISPPQYAFRQFF